MAGDWIKMRVDLRDDPAVFKLAEILNIDELHVIGCLFCFWSWVDKHAVDGRVDGATSRLVDKVSMTAGFADALVAVSWLQIDESGVTMPNFQRHNGESAKERGLKNARQARWRAKKDANVDGEASTSSPTESPTREEKRREDIPTTTVVGMPHQPKFEAKAYLSENGVSDGVAADWLTLRKAKKAGATKTAIDGIIGEAQKAGLSLQTVLEMCCQRGWASFKASWDWEDRSRRTNNPANPTGESAYARTMRERVEELTGRKPQPANGFDNAIDVTPTSVMIGSAL